MVYETSIKNKTVNNKFNTIFTGLAAFAFSILFYYAGHNIISSLILITAAFILVFINKKEYGYYTNPVSIFSGIWFLVIGLAILRLHPVQTQWKLMTWGCLITAFIFFLLGYYSKILNFLRDKFSNSQNKFNNNKKANLFLILIVFSCSLISVIIECCVCEIPLFSKDLNSYMKFGVFFLRYLGVSSALILPLSCIYIAKFKRQISKKEYIFLFVLNAIMFFVPFLIVSRGLALEMLFFTLFVLCSIYKKKEFIIIPILLLIILFCWKSIGSLKNMDDAYLNEALHMELLDEQEQSDLKIKKKTRKKSAIKNVKLMRTYMYFCLNYDNFNLNVNRIKYTYGKSSFFPIYVMTGMKFITHMKDPRKKLKKIIYAYNTYSVMFLSYMDFGIFGIAGFLFVMGWLCFFFEKVYQDMVLSSILKFCCLFSFFSPYLIYPTTFLFYIAFLIIGGKIAFYLANK